jgi:hypothetical protein
MPNPARMCGPESQEMAQVPLEAFIRSAETTGDAGSLEGFAAQAADLPILAKPFTGADLDRVLGEACANV